MNHSLIAFAAALSLIAVSGCNRQEGAIPATVTPPAPAPARSFDTPEAAVDALVAAVEKNDVAALKEILGPGTDELLSSGDEVEDRAEREAFVARYREQHQLGGTPDRLVLQVGDDHWPLPIPVVRGNDGWHFDGEAGADEIVTRRIGANELRTIDVMRGYVEAQEDYAAVAHDDGNAGTYAQKLRSDTGKRNGLYWEAAAGEPESPAGPLLAEAGSENYGATKGEPYHGYLYRILLSQGAAASGGAKDYVVDGKLTGGYALIAWPADYGASGIMTFLVSQDGVVWQRDLGEDTTKSVADITQFNPDDNWTPLAPEVDEEEAVAAS